MARSRGRRQRGGVRSQLLCTSDGMRCGQHFSRPLYYGGCRHKMEYSCSTPQKILVINQPAKEERKECEKGQHGDLAQEPNKLELHVTTEIDEIDDLAIEAERCQDSDDVVKEDDDEEEDEDGRAKRQMLEQLACPRHRRKTLTGWVNRRCNEICSEDADEPDSEDETIRSVLMDALGAASENVEADLSNGTLNLAADDQGTLDLLAWTLEPLLGYTSTEAPQSPKVRFASSSMTFFIKPETETTIALVSTTGNTCWTLDKIAETPVLGNLGTPLGKWREKKTGKIEAGENKDCTTSVPMSEYSE